MLYEIDESCVEALKIKNENVIAFLDELALNRRKCKNIVVAMRNVFLEMAKMEVLSLTARSVYNKLVGKMSERKILLEKTKKFCRIVASENKKEKMSIINEDEHEIIILNINECSKDDFTMNTLMLAENEEDIIFYKLVGKYFLKKADIGYLNINFEEQNGGGSTISKSLSRIISDEKRMCLCIVDSDKKYKEASPGNTMKNIIDIIDEKVQVYFVEIFPLEIHEIENLIPISIMEKVIDKNNWEKQGLEFIKYLTKIDATEKSPRFYFDLKEGILKSSFILENEKDDEIVKKYRKKKQYREYWEKYIEDFGVEINNDSENVLIKGICKKILEHTLKYFNALEEIDMIDVEIPVEQKWMEIGEKIYCWGCVGERIAV